MFYISSDAGMRGKNYAPRIGAKGDKSFQI
jgi:hypothetical protein